MPNGEDDRHDDEHSKYSTLYSTTDDDQRSVVELELFYDADNSSA